MADANFSLGYFTGINTVDQSVRLEPVPVKVGSGMKAAYPLTKAVNVDIDNTYAISSRVGSVKRLSGTDIHSFWADGVVGFFMDGTTLYKLNYSSGDDYDKAELLSGLNRTRMSYFAVNDRVYMTNGSYIGYCSNSSMNSLRVPVETYKIVLPPGQRIAYHKGKLLVARGKVLYISDALCDHYDIRTGFRVFENNITMLRPVDEGVYVADGKTWYLADDPSEYKKEWVSNLDAIPYSDTTIDGAFVGEGLEGRIAIWSTSEGVCLGDNKGAFKIVTPNYIMPPAVEGAAVIRNINGVVHYLATIN
jgi:hypothetical protein